jgi:NADH:ubiquinone oxidoreductase subunit K
MGVELMLTAPVSTWLPSGITTRNSWHPTGWLVFVAIVFAVAAAETAWSTLIISAYRRRQSIIASDLTT